MCPLQLVAGWPSHSSENSAASPVLGAADVPASSAREFSCLGLTYEGSVHVHPGAILYLLLQLGLA